MGIIPKCCIKPALYVHCQNEAKTVWYDGSRMAAGVDAGLGTGRDGEWLVLDGVPMLCCVLFHDLMMIILFLSFRKLAS